MAGQEEAASAALDLAFEQAPGLPAGLPASSWRQRLQAWLTELRPELPPRLQARAYSLGLSLVDDAAIAALNEEWRRKRGPTDVLAFAAQDDDLDGLPPLPPPPPTTAAAAEPAIGDEPLELGDIVISVDTAARQAHEHGHGLEEELLFLACHGLLHLLGWDHPDDASLAAMLARQEQLLAPGQRG
jgi:probable rRNA maturation factor